MKSFIKVALFGAMAVTAVLYGGDVIDINKGVNDPALLQKEDLGNKKVVDENDLGYRKNGLEGSVEIKKADFTRPAPGTSKRLQGLMRMLLH